MNTPTNEQIAAWLDPQRKRAGWWMVTRIPFGNKPMQTKYTGPDFYAPGEALAEVESCLDKHDVWRVRGNYHTYVYLGSESYYRDYKNKPDLQHAHHPTAINLALAKIKEADHA